MMAASMSLTILASPSTPTESFSRLLLWSPRKRYNEQTYSLPTTPLKRMNSQLSLSPPSTKRQRLWTEARPVSRGSVFESDSEESHSYIPRRLFPPRENAPIDNATASSSAEISNLHDASTAVDAVHNEENSQNTCKSLLNFDPVDDLGIWTEEELAHYNADNHYGQPQGEYFTISSPAAEKAYLSTLRSPLLKFCINTFATFSLGMLPFGLSRSCVRHAVVVIAEDMSETCEDELRRIINSTDCGRDFILNCYVGETSASCNGAGRLRAFMKNPEPGTSIGVERMKSSFSLGPYIKIRNDEELYAVSVFHGLKLPVDNVSSDDPALIVHQPSLNDHNDNITETERALHLYSEGPRANLPTTSRMRDAFSSELDSLRSLDTRFGQVLYGEMDVVESEGENCSIDWCLIKVDQGREGENSIAFKPETIENRAYFGPQDNSQYNITQEGTLMKGIRVVKAGRSTGVTVGNVDFIKFDVKLPGSSTTTSEYTITSPLHKAFSTRGDSGSPVIGADGELVGIILGGSEGVELPKGREELGYVKLSYVTPWDLVKSRIEAAVGGEIRLFGNHSSS